MNIVWDEEKNKKLQRERQISFEEIAELIVQKKYLRIVENAARPRQRLFLISIHDYVYAVPFVFDEQGNVVLKTAFPSRKFNKKYGMEKK